MLMSIARARALRSRSTWAEKCLWRLLKSRRLAGYKFRRQRFAQGFYLDFYCHEAKLAIELDGSGHGYPMRQKSDKMRDAYLLNEGILVKRFWNHQLLKSEDRDALVHNVWLLLQKRSPHPGNAPLPPYRRKPDKPSN